MKKRDQNKKTSTKQELANQFSIVGVNDLFSNYPSKGLTPIRLAALLREADAGDVYQQMELFTEMLEKDGHLMSLFGHIRIVVTGKNYEIVPGSSDKHDIEIAGEAAKMFARIKSWRTCCGHILDCAGKAYSVCQNIWTPYDDRLDITGLKYIDQKNFRFGKASDPHRDMNELRLLVDPTTINAFRGIVPDDILSIAAVDGIPLDVTPVFRQRFSVALSLLRSSSPARAALLRTCTYMFLFKNYDVKWWVKFAEILLGIRVGKYDSSEPEQKKIVEDAVRNIGQDAALVISKNSDFQFAEMMTKASSHQVYSELKDWCNEEMTKAVLLHAAANEATPGKLGNESGAEDALQLLYEYYAGILDETVTDDQLRPWVDINYGEQENYPSYHTQVEKGVDLVEHAKLINLLQMAGKKVSKKYVDNKFGIPSPDPDDPEDEALEPLPPSNQMVTAKSDLMLDKKKLLTQR
jgi:phage gp29-like protein